MRRAIGHEFAVIESIGMIRFDLSKKHLNNQVLFFRLAFPLRMRMGERVALAEIEKATRRWLFQTLHSKQA